MTSQIFSKYVTQNVPRYTSYPTAPHFHDGVTGEDYAGWLSRLDPQKPVSLYLHVPFCRQLCWYCGCNMKLATRQVPISAYNDTLIEEIGLVAGHLPARMKVSHLHWGGGTPTALEPDELERAMAEVAKHFDFTDQADMAIESDPRTLDAVMIERIGALGFNRASFGVQEFDPKVQQAINRIQPPEMVRASVDGLRKAGVTSINFDLIYGLPHQTVETLLETIRICGEMRPDRIALFGYAHVPWMAKKQRLIDEAALPGASERLEQARASAEALIEAGYVPIGLDHFALPDDAMAIAHANGTLRRNFQGYTTDATDTLIGLGATSIGRTPSGYLQNTVETGAWARTVEAGQLPVMKGVVLSLEDRVRGAVIEQLMCFGTADLDRIALEHGVEPALLDDSLLAQEELVADGLVKIQDRRVVITEDGATLVRVIASKFDAYFQASVARHAVAV
ncbi:MAG: oxygen-independent coproporphyrinogen III oxidase [Pseudomonadota bacterium]